MGSKVFLGCWLTAEVARARYPRQITHVKTTRVSITIGSIYCPGKTHVLLNLNKQTPMRDHSLICPRVVLLEDSMTPRRFRFAFIKSSLSPSFRTVQTPLRTPTRPVIRTNEHARAFAFEKCLYRTITPVTPCTRVSRVTFFFNIKPRTHSALALLHICAILSLQFSLAYGPRVCSVVGVVVLSLLLLLLLSSSLRPQRLSACWR